MGQRNKRKTAKKHTSNAIHGKKQPPPSRCCPPTATSNRPKNLLIKDATLPFEFAFYRFGSPVSLRINQTPAEELWPGGALWDLGVLLAQVLVLLTRNASLTNPCKTTTMTSQGGSIRLLASMPHIVSWNNTSVLELGCGVGLTGLVAAALGAKRVVLTDLEHVICGITQPNVELNASISKTTGCVTAVPLCWGNRRDEHSVAAILEESAAKSGKNKSSRKKKTCTDHDEKDATSVSCPGMILIGDVAYQHKPGAPSHFDALLSTLLRFVSPDTLVVFGTRMRMPASADLLDMFHEHFVEQVEPPLEAHEIDESFGNLGKKHNMTIHFLKLKQQ